MFNNLSKTWTAPCIALVVLLTACTSPSQSDQPENRPDTEPEPTQQRFVIKPEPLVIEPGASVHVSVKDAETGRNVGFHDSITWASPQGPLMIADWYGSPRIRTSYFTEPQTVDLTLNVIVDSYSETIRAPVEIVSPKNELQVRLLGVYCTGGDYYMRLEVTRSGDVSQPITIAVTGIDGMDLEPNLSVPAGYRTYSEHIPVNIVEGFTNEADLEYIASDGNLEYRGVVNLLDPTQSTCYGTKLGIRSEFEVTGAGLTYLGVGEASIFDHLQSDSVLRGLPSLHIRHYAAPMAFGVQFFDTEDAEVFGRQEGHSCELDRRLVNDNGIEYRKLVCRRTSAVNNG